MTDLAAIKAKLANGELGDALKELQTYMASNPEDTDGLYLQAVALRYSGHLKEALYTLSRLKRLAPSHSRAHQEEGHVHRDAGNGERALAAYQRALTLNPALEASMQESVRLLSASGQQRRAIHMQAQLETFQALPKALRAIIELIAQNKLLKAEELCRTHLKHHPRDVEGMRLLADIGIRLGVLEDAEFLLESAVEFAPQNLPVQLDYVNVLRKRQKFQAALAHARKLLAQYPENLQIKSVCAIEYMQTGDFDDALALLDEVLAQIPQDPRTLVTYGHALKTSGRTDDAIESYRKAAEAEPEHGESYYSLANLKTYRFSDDEVARMRMLNANENLGTMDRVYLNFALGKAFEDRSDFATAFTHYAQGNALKKAQSRYDADRMHEEIAATREVCYTQLFRDRADFGCQARDPIFILGLPRAGSTLLEQILSSHSQVDGTLELPNILSLSQRLRRQREGGGYPMVLHSLSREECLAYGEAYIEDTRIHRDQAPFFIDKMPNNFRHIGLIKLILPNARIIDARRAPMACCFSGYKQLFAEGQEFSYDLTDIGRYYRDYEELMSHWDTVLPGYVLRVQHEDVVADLEGQVRRMLEFCGLPFEESCLRYYETERSVRTPSSEQVRQPIFTDALEQWRNFEPWLQPLKSALGLVEHE